MISLILYNTLLISNNDYVNQRYVTCFNLHETNLNVE